MKYSGVFALSLFGCGSDTPMVREPEPLLTPPPATTEVVVATPTPSAASSSTPPTATAVARATNAVATAVPSAAPSAAASTAAPPAGPAPLEGANVNIGSTTVDGLPLKDVSCKTDGGLGGLFGSLTIAAGLSKRKAALDKCGNGETRAHIWQKGGKVTKAEIVGGSKSESCVHKALLGAPATMDSECLLTIVHGK